MIVLAELGIGRLHSSEKAFREKALSIPLSAALTELISFPTTSFFGFERVKNCYFTACELAP